jgi:hypothetical protein
MYTLYYDKRSKRGVRACVWGALMGVRSWLNEPFAGDNPTTDIHATDPARLKQEIKKDLGIKDPIGSINDARPDPDPISGIQSAKDHYMKKKKN